MTNQEAFDKVVKHLMAQDWKQSRKESGGGIEMKKSALEELQFQHLPVYKIIKLLENKDD